VKYIYFLLLSYLFYLPKKLDISVLPVSVHQKKKGLKTMYLGVFSHSIIIVFKERDSKEAKQPHTPGFEKKEKNTKKEKKKQLLFG